MIKISKLYPNIYLNKITDITIDYLKKNNIKGVILDIDNTLIGLDRMLTQDKIDWVNTLKQNEIKSIIVSNTNKKDKVEKVAKSLDLAYTYFAGKPNKKAFLNAAKKLDLKPENIASVGDQIFTDVWGANKVNMHSILVKPLEKKDIMITKVKRPFERIVIKRYLRKIGEK